MTRIGVIADTHCPEFSARLPQRLFEVLAGVELILHAGDVNREETLADLSRIAPVTSGRGDHDAQLASLPAVRELTVDGRRIVVVHGNRSRWLEEPQTLLWTLPLGHYKPHKRLPAVLRARFPDADVVVFGHTHRAFIDAARKPLVFNPGGVHQWNRLTTAERLRQRVGWFEWCWLQVARHIRSSPPPTVRILEIGPAGAEPRILPL